MQYSDRRGNKTQADTDQDKLLQKLYASQAGRTLLRMLSAPLFSRLVGWFLNTRISTLMIDPFVKKNQIEMRAYIPKRFRSYNEFFCRQIKPQARPIDSDPTHVVSPADGKVTAYPITEDGLFSIKGSYYTIESLLQDTELSNAYLGGMIVICRLSVDNYHRYIYANTGVKDMDTFIPGRLYTVNPCILSHVNIYKENSRAYCTIDTEQFGEMIQMEVGALCVGKIVNYHDIKVVCRGEEKGRFEFGGSTVVMLFRPGTVRIDADILQNSQEDCETLVKLGERIGQSCGN